MLLYKKLLLMTFGTTLVNKSVCFTLRVPEVIQSTVTLGSAAKKICPLVRVVVFQPAINFLQLTKHIR